MQSRLSNIFPSFLRIFSFAIKIFFIFLLAKYLPANEVGIYGLFTGFLTFASYLLGFELSKVYVRDICNRTITNPAGLIRSIMLVSLIGMFLLSIPLFLWLQSLGLEDYFWIVSLVLLLDSLTQEIYKILIAQGNTYKASLLLFIKQGGWPLFATFIILISPSLRSIFTVMLVWLAFSVTSLLFAFRSAELKIDVIVRSKVDFSWLKKSLAISLGFLIIALVARAIMFLDRLFLADFVTFDILGVYVFYISFSGAYIALLDVAVLSISTPRLIRYAANNDASRYRRELLKVIGFAFGFILFFFGGVLVFAYNWMHFFFDEQYIDHLDFLWLVFLFSLTYLINVICFTILYTLNFNAGLLASNFINLIVVSVSLLVLSLLKEVTIYNVCSSLILGSVVSIVYRFILLTKYDIGSFLKGRNFNR